MTAKQLGIRFGRYLGWGCGAVLCGGSVLPALVWCFRVPLLRSLGEGWQKSEPVTGGADAIVVLGGGAETRTFKAAQLFQQGVAPAIWVLKPEPEPTAALGLRMGSFEVTLEALKKQGVPESAIEVLGEHVSSTWDEALAVRERVRSKPGLRRIVLPTDPFHARRVDWLFTRVLREERVDVRVVPVQPLDYQVETWWRTEHGLLALQNEVLKYGYYRLRYAGR